MKRPHSATVRDATRFIDDVEALWPGGVGVVGGVVDVVDPKSYGVVESLDEIVRDGNALSESFRLGVADVILHVGLHLPLVGRVGFAYINGQKIGVIFVVVVNLHHVTDVAAERRSSIAAEDDDKRSSAGAFANVEMVCTVEREEAGVRSVVADFERAAVHVGQGIAEHAVSVFGTAGHLAKQKKYGHQNDCDHSDCPLPEERHSYLFTNLLAGAYSFAAATRNLGHYLHEPKRFHRILMAKRSIPVAADE
jgi:hypothetical protein